MLRYGTTKIEGDREAIHYEEEERGADADGGLEKDGRAGAQAWCSIIGQRSVHYNTMGNAAEGERKKEGHYAKR